MGNESRLSDASGLIAFALFFTSTDTAWSSSGKPGFKYGTSHKSRADGDMWVGGLGYWSVRRVGRNFATYFGGLGERWQREELGIPISLPVELGSWDIYIIYIYIYMHAYSRRETLDRKNKDACMRINRIQALQQQIHASLATVTAS